MCRLFKGNSKLSWICLNCNFGNGQDEGGKHVGAKLGNKMIALCSAAIGFIYVAGYVSTEPSRIGLAQTLPVATSPTQPSQSTSGNPTPSTVTNQKYRDGTYSGQGSNRIGTVQVALVIKSDKITSVQITQCDTHYPESDIDMLPQQVVSRQSDNVDLVSGATLSTENFQNAIQQALQQALANPSATQGSGQTSGQGSGDRHGRGSRHEHGQGSGSGYGQGSSQDGGGSTF